MPRVRKLWRWALLHAHTHAVTTLYWSTDSDTSINPYEHATEMVPRYSACQKQVGVCHLQGVRGSPGHMNEIQALKEKLAAAERALRAAQFEHAKALQSKEAAQVGCK